MATILRGTLTDYPILTNDVKTDSILLKLLPENENKEIGVICKNNLARIILSYYRKDSVIEVIGNCVIIDKRDFSTKVPETVLGASNIKFLSIKKQQELEKKKVRCA